MRHSGIAFTIGFALVAGYWIHLRPPGLSRIGYSQNLAETELTRQIVADDLVQYGGPRFVSTRVMAPTGINAAYFPWSMERDWLGAWFWLWNSRFPFLWVYFGASLLVSYLAIGWFCRKLGLTGAMAWVVAVVVVVLNIPRHHKVYHHFALITQHWIDVAFFLDAWIWARFWREHRWSQTLELWRLVVLIATFGLSGVFWGPMLVEWLIVRAALLVGAHRRRRAGLGTAIEGTWSGAALPIGIGLGLIVVSLRWFLPLTRQALLLGDVPQRLVYTAPILMVLRPLWLEFLLLPLRGMPPFSVAGIADALRHTGLPALGDYETVVSVGWVYWVPLVAGLFVMRRRSGGPGWGVFAPFLAMLAFALLYLGAGPPFAFQAIVRRTVPFMLFFRVASRMGLLLGSLISAMVALAWPELERALRAGLAASNPARRRWLKLAVGAFVVSSLVEAGRLTLPVIAMPAMDASLVRLMDDLRRGPGTTVLNAPFCVASGTAVCSGQCPQYARSLAPMYLTGYHDKRVFGAYLSRLVPAQCEIYDRAPYVSWFDAWQRDRCFTDIEWREFCGFLDAHPEIGRLVVFADLWRAADTPSCRGALEARLGPPRGEASMSTIATRGAMHAGLTRVRVYDARCAAIGK